VSEKGGRRDSEESLGPEVGPRWYKSLHHANLQRSGFAQEERGCLTVDWLSKSPVRRCCSENFGNIKARVASASIILIVTYSGCLCREVL